MIIGVVVALSREARLVRRCVSGTDLATAVLLSEGGMGAARARDGARALVARGAGLLLSTGYAGGLDASVRAGDLLVPQTILDEDGNRHATWAEGRDRVLGVLGGARRHTGTLVSHSTVIAGIEAKRDLARSSGAWGVDLESAAVAAVGRESAVPVLVLRSVSDGGGCALPRAALASARADGRVAVTGLLAALARRPWELPAMLRLARNVGAAERTLESALREALPLLAAMKTCADGAA